MEASKELKVQKIVYNKIPLPTVITDWFYGNSHITVSGKSCHFQTFGLQSCHVISDFLL